MFDYNYIAIEGNIGAGKTTLAKFLSRAFESELLLEEFSENKFLKEFYKSGDYAIHSEIQFLIDRSKQLNQFFQQKDSLIISDYYPSKSLIFSEMNLNKSEFLIVGKLTEMLFKNLPKPQILFFIDRDINDVMNNIHKRGRSYERNMNINYIEKLANGYEIWLSKLNIPVIRINANSICLENPILLKESFQKLLSMPHISAQRRVSINSKLNYEPI
jgi:deoxyguanosine kinase